MNHALLQVFTRAAIAKALSVNNSDAVLVAGQRWGNASAVVGALRASVAGVGIADFNPMDEAGIAFVESVAPMTVMGRLAGLRRVPSNTPVGTLAEQATAYWVGESRVIPMSRAAFDNERLVPRKLAALTVFSQELVKNPSTVSEALIQRDLQRASSKLSDLSFLNPANAGVPDIRPASVTYGVTPIPSTGDLAADIAAAIDAFEGDLDTAVWCLSTTLGAEIAIRAGGKGLAADLGARGGTLVGLPALTTSAGLPATTDGATIVLLDAAGIVVADEGADVSSSNSAVISMSDDPDIDEPVLVSMFQTNSVGMKVVRNVNWKAARPPVVVTGCMYSAS